jgi:thiol-disulfide isomerase/thioredoxin
MKKILLIIGCFADTLSFVLAQNTAVLNDTLALGDAFFEPIAPAIVAQREDLLKTAIHADFWKQFNEKFAADFDTKAQHKRILKENNVDTYEMSIFGARRKQGEFYKSYPQYAQLSDEFKYFIENHIRYHYWHLLLAHPIIRANADPALLKIYSLPAVMLEGLDTKKMMDEKLLYLPSYRQFLWYYVTYFNSKNRQFEKYKNMATAMADKATFAIQNLPKQTQKYYLTRLLTETCEATPASAIKQTLAQLASLPQAEAYVKTAQNRCADAMAKVETPAVAAASKTNAKGTGFELIGTDDQPFYTSEFKGKYVYVDFWASWCGPCRQEFPFSKEMQAKLTDKQKKKIVFLNISIDEKKEAWLKAVETLKLEGVNGWNPEMSMKLKIQSIPRYMILDKDGNIMNPNAGRPSNPATLNELIDLIEK